MIIWGCVSFWSELVRFCFKVQDRVWFPTSAWGTVSGRINCPPKSLATMKKRLFVHKYRPFCLMHSSSVCKCPEDYILDRTETTAVVAANVSILLWWPPLWSSGQSFWLQIQRSRVRFPALPDFLSSSGLERGPLSLVRSIEELLE